MKDYNRFNESNYIDKLDLSAPNEIVQNYISVLNILETSDIIIRHKKTQEEKDKYLRKKEIYLAELKIILDEWGERAVKAKKFNL